ncbi:MAG: TonB-dependent receptor domain-containing protein, partial [Gemmatimonadaceae bacterium]
LQRSAELSWALGETAGGARRLWSDRARLRAAYGSIARPASLLALAPPSTGPGPAPAPGRPRPERTREAELGADATYLGGRLDVALTGYDKLTKDGELPGPPSAASTFDTRLGQALDVQNRGVELRLGATLLRSARFRWDAGLAFAANRNRVRRVSTPMSLIGQGVLGFAFGALQKGLPLGALQSSPIVGYADRNGDGVIGECQYDGAGGVSPPTCELTFAASRRFGGTPYPTREGSLGSSLGVGRYVTLSGQLDYRGGVRLYNYPHLIGCLLESCREHNDPSTSLGDQARTAVHGELSPYLEDAGYVKLREVAVTLRLPERWMRPAGALTVTAAVHNIATWTRYSGGDPEVAMNGSPLSGVDLFAQAQPRTLVLRAEIAM